MHTYYDNKVGDRTAVEIQKKMKSVEHGSSRNRFSKFRCAVFDLIDKMRHDSKRRHATPLWSSRELGCLISLVITAR